MHEYIKLIVPTLNKENVSEILSTCEYKTTLKRFATNALNSKMDCSYLKVYFTRSNFALMFR